MAALLTVKGKKNQRLSIENVLRQQVKFADNHQFKFSAGAKIIEEEETEEFSQNVMLEVDIQKYDYNIKECVYNNPYFIATISETERQAIK